MESTLLINTDKDTDNIKKLKEKRKVCEENIGKYEDKIYQTKLLIKQIDSNIRNACPKHNWETDREPGMYGDRFTYCTVCGSDY